MGDFSKAPRIVSLGEGINPSYVKWVNNDQLVLSVRQTQKYRSNAFQTSFLTRSTQTP
jgi:hypothetical protein